MDSVNFTLNDKNVVYRGSLNIRLLDVLREKFGNIGVKCGCKEGECGACSVIIDGKLANSCMIAMGRIDGSTVTTIEGYKKTKRYQVLDAAYASTGAVQCGYCIPGMVLASECILSKNPHPTEAQIRIGIAGNLCRCTGYNAIVKAITSAAKEGEGLW